MNGNYYLIRDGRKMNFSFMDILITEISVIWIVYLVGYLIPILYK